MDYDRLRFSYAEVEDQWIPVDMDFDASILSDRYRDILGFTGSFVGLSCQDLAGTGIPADFDYFEYRGNPG